jgi:HPt (histidine-containing phosphotransfer) domain-containing protein
MGDSILKLDSVLQRMENDRELVREIFEVFIEEAPVRAERFKAALAASDMDAVMRLAHALKGASGTLTAEPLRQACYDLEHAARAGEKEKVDALAPPVFDMLEKTVARMAELKEEL